MNTQIFKLTIVAGVLTLGIVRCTNSAEQKANREKAIRDSAMAAQAYQDSINDYILFRKESEERLQANNQRIADLKEDMKKEREDLRVQYDKEINKLDQDNEELSVKLHQYKRQSKNEWETFKHDCNRDMDSLGKSISRIAERNMNKS